MFLNGSLKLWRRNAVSEFNHACKILSAPHLKDKAVFKLRMFNVNNSITIYINSSVINIHTDAHPVSGKKLTPEPEPVPVYEELFYT